ncbi:hypothetical protein D3C77_534930 [compost metagenome]
MSRMVLSMDEIINAICIHIAGRNDIPPTEVQVELSWEEETGYSAEVWAKSRSQFLSESQMIEAIIRYVLTEYKIQVFRQDVRLDLDEEITAIINT